jgi:hypothetical protein
MVNRPKAIGTAAETAVARYLVLTWPMVERRALRGECDAGDIAGMPQVCWEVKGGAAARTASDGQVQAWLEETEAERVYAGATLGVLVLARAGYGVARVDRWWCIVPCTDEDGFRLDMPVRMHLSTMVDYLRRCGI